MNPVTWLSSSEPTWKERSNSTKLSSDFRVCAITHHTHTCFNVNIETATQASITSRSACLVLPALVWRQRRRFVRLPSWLCHLHGSCSWCSDTNKDPMGISVMISYQAILVIHLGLPKLQCDRPVPPLSPTSSLRNILSGRWSPGEVLFFERRFPRGKRKMRAEALGRWWIGLVAWNSLAHSVK